MNATQFYLHVGRKTVQEIVNASCYPIIGYDPVGMNFIHEHCEHAPCSYHPQSNSWSEEYAVSFISIPELENQLIINGDING